MGFRGKEYGKLLYEEPDKIYKDEKGIILFAIFILNVIFIIIFLNYIYTTYVNNDILSTQSILIIIVIWLIYNLILYYFYFRRIKLKIYEKGFTPLVRIRKKDEFIPFGKIDSIKINKKKISIYLVDGKGTMINVKTIGIDEFEKAKKVILSSYKKWKKSG